MTSNFHLAQFTSNRIGMTISRYVTTTSPGTDFSCIKICTVIMQILYLSPSISDDFLHGDSNDKILGNSTRSNQQNPNNNSLEQTFLNVPLSSYLEGNAPRTGTTAKILPDLANRIAQRNFGPLVPDVSPNSTNVLDGGSANSAPLLDSLPLASAYTITRNMAPSHTLETSFCNMDLPNNKLPKSR